MSTMVCFHAHPDDECIITGGVVSRAVAEGHRVVLVVATDGSHGEVPEDLAPGETLVDRRRAETERSAAVLGISEIVWLGYRDSGMTGWEQNGHTDAFCQADVESAAQRLAEVLRREAAEVLTTYDWHGNYGHPDHIQVHRVGNRAGELAATPRVFEATMNRDHFRELQAERRRAGQTFGPPGEEEWDPDGPADDGNPMGLEASELTHAVDVSAWVEAKRRSMACHASQISDAGFFMQMETEVFRTVFGTEWFRRVGAPPGLAWRWLFD